MNRFTYREQHITFLKENYPLLPAPDLAVMFNAKFGTDKTASALTAACRNRKIYCGRRGKYRPPEEMKVNGNQLQFIAGCFQDYSVPGLTRAFNKIFPDDQASISQMLDFVGTNKAQLEHLKSNIKVRNIKSTSGRRINSSHFKSGNRAANEKPIGAEVFRKKSNCLMVKVAGIDQRTGANGYWRPKHLLVWTENNGPIPKGVFLLLWLGVSDLCVG